MNDENCRIIVENMDELEHLQVYGNKFIIVAKTSSFKINYLSKYGIQNAETGLFYLEISDKKQENFKLKPIEIKGLESPQQKFFPGGIEVVGDRLTMINHDYKNKVDTVLKFWLKEEQSN